MKTPEFTTPPTVVVYRKRKNGKKYMIVTEKDVDTVNNENARKPIIDFKYEIIELGVGSSLIKTWMNKHGIEKFEKN